MGESIRVVQFGCGPIGCSIVRLAAQRASLAVGGAIDIDPALVGRDLGDVAEVGRALGAPVRADAEAALRELRPEVVFHTTGSRVADVYDQIALLTAAGANVVSTCEELAFPAYREPALAERLHDLACPARRVDPGHRRQSRLSHGYVAAVHVDAVRHRGARACGAGAGRLRPPRSVSAQDRRRADGSGVPRRGSGAAASATWAWRSPQPLLSAGLGWNLDGISESIEPVLLERDVRSAYANVPVGRVAGLKQVAVGTCGGKPMVELEFQAYVGAPRSYETVTLAGTPPLEVTIEGGTPGDTATAAIVVNSAAPVAAAAPGLYSMKDLPVVGCAAA